MVTDAVARFLACLPAGEWADINVIDDPGGMMASSTDTIHATATCVRDGRRAYLKCILGRGASAGDATLRLVGVDRLLRVKTRLESARRNDILPLAQLLDVGMIEGINGLLIAMAEVQPVHGMLTSGYRSDELATKVLRTLSAARCDGWIHYDICPKNTGLTAEGRPVFIDLESLYFASDIRVDVSYPAFKFHRTPADLHRACQNAAIDGNLSVEMATAKHDAELLVLGAECCMGLFPLDFSVSSVETWCAEARCSEQIMQFWREILLNLARGHVTAPEEVAAQLEELGGDGKSAFWAQTGKVPDRPGPVSDPTLPVVSASVNLPVVKLERKRRLERAQEWADLEDVRRDLRRDVLGREEIEEYRVRLERLANENPRERRYWEELLLLALAYEKDPLRAESCAARALEFFHDDSDFLRQRQLARMWANGS